jgi:transposase InsO family protein
MLDDGVCAVSASSVYRVLDEHELVCRWTPTSKDKAKGRQYRPDQPDQLWQTDIRYTRVDDRHYYLLSFMDVYSRYIVHHELLRNMDGLSVSIAAADALAKVPADVMPNIQSDNGSCFVSGEFAETLKETGITHTKIRPHTPTDNAEIERCHRTIGQRIDEQAPADYARACRVVDEVMNYYNNTRLHSALNFLRPIDYYRGNPEALLARRRRKLSMARELRKQENLKLRQRLIPFPEEKPSQIQNADLCHFL